MRLSVIVPVLNGEATLGEALDALEASVPAPDEIIVVDDGSTDRTAEIARERGIRVLAPEGGPLGPGQARNIGVRASDGALVGFVDADVVVEPDALAKLVAAIESDEAVVAAFGSYDDAPRERNAVSLYANLRHHYMHQSGSPNASTFWAGLGVARRDDFVKAGGYDAAYERPSIEDIHLGLEWTSLGKEVRLVKDARGKHLKHWSLPGLWKTDVFARAIPWAKLLTAPKESDRGQRALNARSRERLASMVAVATVCSIVLGAVWPSWLLVALAGLGCWAVLCADFLRLLVRVGGFWNGMVGTDLHFAYYVYSGLVFGTFLVKERLTGQPGRG